MRQLWVCDFCHHSDEDSVIVQEHEDNCFLNPANRNCFTCEHYTENFSDIFGSAPTCGAGNPDFFDVMEGDLPCDLWEPEV